MTAGQILSESLELALNNLISPPDPNSQVTSVGKSVSCCLPGARVDEAREVGVLGQEHHGVELVPEVVVAVHADAEDGRGQPEHAHLGRPPHEGARVRGEERLQRPHLPELLQPRQAHLPKGRVLDGRHLQKGEDVLRNGNGYLDLQSVNYVACLVF